MTNDYLPVPFLTPEQRWEEQLRDHQERERQRIEEEFGADLDRLERMRKAFELDAMDIPCREIGRRLGCSHMTAWRDIKEYKMYLARTVLDPVEYLGSQLAECSSLRAALWTRLRTGVVDADKAAKAILAVQLREERLLNLTSFAAGVDEFEFMSDEELAANA